ncbi:MAG: glycosyltransferase [Candidatus Bruticola sp.]
MVVRNFLQGYQTVKSNYDKICFLSFKPHLLEDIKQEIGHLGECLAFKNAPDNLDVCWYPWDRIDIPLPCAKVLTVHDVTFWKKCSFFRAYRNWKRLSSCLEYAVATSEYVKNEEFDRTFGDEHKILTVCYNSICSIFFRDQARTLSNNQEGRLQYLNKHTQGAPFIFFVGNPYDQNKNFLQLLQAFDHIKDEFPHKILVAGPEPQYKIGLREKLFPSPSDLYIQSIQKLTDKLSHRLIFSGQLTQEEITEPYSYCDCLAAVSTYEGFFLPLAEAMSCSCIILSSQCAALPEVGGSVPFYYDHNSTQDLIEKLRFILTNRRTEKYQNLFMEKIKQGLKRVQQFTPEINARNMLNIFTKAVQKHMRSQK